ncbi:unnamed protein product [Ixodes persulcatus]
MRSFGEEARRKRLTYGISHAIRKERLKRTACRSTISWKGALEEYGHLSRFLRSHAHLPHWSRSFVSLTNKRARIERRREKCRGVLFYCVLVVADDLNMVIRERVLSAEYTLFKSPSTNIGGHQCFQCIANPSRWQPRKTSLCSIPRYLECV